MLFTFLRYSHIFLTTTLIGSYLILNFSFINRLVSTFVSTEKEKLEIIERYRQVLNTIFRILVGLLLISFQFPFLYKYFSKNNNIDLAKYGNTISPIIGAAGVIVLFTVSKDDVVKTIEFFKEKLIKM